jgi:hypothetical protein
MKVTSEHLTQVLEELFNDLAKGFETQAILCNN